MAPVLVSDPADDDADTPDTTGCVPFLTIDPVDDIDPTVDNTETPAATGIGMLAIDDRCAGAPSDCV
jgi:hypothetical protein